MEPTKGLRQRTNVSEKVNLGFREDDAVHPLLVVALAGGDRGEEASLAGFRPPSGHQSARNQGPSSLAVRG